MPLPQCNFGCHSAHSDNFSHCSLSLSSAIGTVVFTASFFLSSSVAMQRAVCFASSLLGSSQHPNAAVASVVAAAASSSSAGTFRTADGTGGTAAAAAHNRQPSLWGKCVCVCDQAHPILLPNVHTTSSTAILHCLPKLSVLRCSCRLVAAVVAVVFAASAAAASVAVFPRHCCRCFRLQSGWLAG